MFATFLIDRMCLGVKNILTNCNFSKSELDDFIAKMSSTEGRFEYASSSYFNNMVYGALDYAKELGFNPPKEFALAELFLDENLVDDGIDEIEMGW